MKSKPPNNMPSKPKLKSPKDFMNKPKVKATLSELVVDANLRVIEL